MTTSPSVAPEYHNSTVTPNLILMCLLPLDAPELIIQHRVVTKRITILATFDEFIASLEHNYGEQGKGKPFEVFGNWFMELQATCEITRARSYDRVVGYCSVVGSEFGSHIMQNSSCKVWPKYDVWDRY